MNIDHLPNDVLVLILIRLPGKQIIRTSLVNKRFQQICSGEQLWRMYLERVAPSLSHSIRESKDTPRKWFHASRSFLFDSAFFPHSRAEHERHVKAAFEARLKQKGHIEVIAYFVGAKRCGKSALGVQFVQHIFVDEYTPSWDDVLYQKQPEYRGTSGRLTIQTLHSIEGPTFFSNAEQFAQYKRNILHRSVIALLFSITSRDSFEYIQKVYHETIRKEFLESYTHAKNSEKKLTSVQNFSENSPLPVVLIGTMCDLQEKREVSLDEATAFATQLNCPYIECSSKTNTRVQEAFSLLIDTHMIFHCSNKISEKGNEKCTLQ